MRYRKTSTGAAALLLTLACNQRVEIGHGLEAGAGGEDAATGGDVQGTGGNSAGNKAGNKAGTGGISGGDDPTVGEGATSGASPTTSGGTAGTGLVGGPIPADTGPQARAEKLDLLLAVDNSISMAEKQKLFAKTVPELLKRLVSPYCTTTNGDIISRPVSVSEACPSGSQREFAPVRDLHVGVISSSLGSHGAGGGARDVCTSPSDDDHAHLLGLERPNVPSYDDRGYLKWDPDGVASPPGENDVQAFADALETMIVSAGEQGCGYEAQLESVYRFLVDPEPPQSVEVDAADHRAKLVGVDDELLAQRADFLRPDSAVAVLLLTDENDCSVQDGGYGYLVPKAAPMFRSTSACLTDPNDRCCQSCGEATAHAGCGPIAEDSECVKGVTLPAEDDDMNLRCFDQKRRFGFDLLYPTARYVSGFGGGAVPDRAGNLVPNPLFHRDGQDRDPSLFTFAVVAGVPWQDLASTGSLNGGNLEYLAPSELTAQGRWSVILGDPQADVPPADPFMRESIEERSGQNPITGDAIVDASSIDPQANAINGHEQGNRDRNDLQYACTFELAEPVDCGSATSSDTGCDCFPEDLTRNRPLCNRPGGGAPETIQYYGKAYPALRPLAVAEELGRRTVLGSICARNTQDEERSDYGYRPAFGALGQRIAATLLKP
jgi:hypothetical protein